MEGFMTDIKTDKKSHKKTNDDCTINTLDEVWQQNPEIIRYFLDIRPDYQQLCTEVEYILRKRLSVSGIEISTISSRAKTLNSFLEKLQRKKYDDPFKQISDFAGVRVVCLYRNDVVKIEEIVRSEFFIVEEINKVDELGIDKFGYEAVHFVVRLGESTTGARYDNLKMLVCEVQIKTVVQDAWAIIQHHLVYKKESQVPSQLQRKLNSLSGLFDTVDDQFERIRSERDTYLIEIRGTVNEPETFLANELNLDSFKEYLKYKFPNRPVESFNGQARMVLDALIKKKYAKLDDVHQLLEKTSALRSVIIPEIRSELREDKDKELQSNIEVAIALAATSQDWRELIHWGSRLENAVAEALEKRNLHEQK